MKNNLRALLLTVFGTPAELERENIWERQREGIEIAKSEGKHKGRKLIDYGRSANESPLQEVAGG